MSHELCYQCQYRLVTEPHFGHSFLSFPFPAGLEEATSQDKVGGTR